MSVDNFPKFFLCSNSADGFINGFNDLTFKKKGWQTYLIKGGPGTGKSSFMKKIAQRAALNKIDTEIIPCSSDPASLDGVILKDKKTLIIDATAPHVVEPVYPGVYDHILDFSRFWNSDVLKDGGNEIITLTNKNKELHKRASGYLSAMGQVMRNNMKIALLAADIDKTFDYAEKLAKRYLKRQNKQGVEWVKYLSAVTPEGYIFYKDSISKLCEKRVVVMDELGAVSSMIFSAVKDIALSFGYEIITVKNNILPGEKIDHILIPEISLAFCTKNSFNNIDSENVRLVHDKRFADREILKENRNKIAFGNQLIGELLQAAVNTLNEAKAVHDLLEAYYIQAMDFKALSVFAEEFSLKITER